MNLKEVLEIYSGLENLGVLVWIDGGWSVDALLGRQIRSHSDLDIAIQWKDVQKLQEFLEKREYSQIREDSKWNFVYKNSEKMEIDIHVFIYDDKGNIVDGIMYSAESLTGSGIINGQLVRCISPKYMIKFLDEWVHKHPHKYLDEIFLLCQKFNIEFPEEYKKIISQIEK